MRWVDKEMRGLGMWKAAEDGDGKVQGIRRKDGKALRMETGRCRRRSGDGVRWVDKEMGGLEMWKAQRIEAGRCRGRKQEGS